MLVINEGKTWETRLIHKNEAKVLKTYKGMDNTYNLVQTSEGIFIGMKTSRYLNAELDFVEDKSIGWLIVDSDAGHLNKPEFEGVFECRCDNLELELRALASY